MSALYPPSDAVPARREGEAATSERERALLLELQAVRTENEYLRQRYAAQLAGGLAAAGRPPHSADLPLSLESAQQARRDGAHLPAQVEYEALFAALGSVFPIGIFRIDEGGVLTHVDAQLQQIFGLPREDFPNFGWLHRVHPDDLRRVQDTWFEAIEHAQATSIEFRLIRPDQQTVHVVVRNAPLHDEQQRLVGQLGFVQDITPLRALEAQARLSDTLNRQIIESSPDCTKVIDLEGRVVQMTEQGCRLVEVDDFEAVRLSDWASWWPTEGEAQVREAIALARAGQGSRFVAFGQTFKGTPKWWDTVVTPITDADGRPAMLLAVSRDITERHQQQQEIRRFNAELERRVRERTDELAEAKERVSMALAEAQTLYNQAPCGYHSVGADGTFLLINRTALEWLGFERHEVIGRLRFEDVVVPEQVALVQERLARLVAGERLEAAEFTMRRRDGSTFAALLSSTIVTDARGHFLRTNNTLVDITERKRIEERISHLNEELEQRILERSAELLESEQRFRLMVDNLRDYCIFFMDAEGRITDWTDSAQRMDGHTPVQMLGRHYGVLFDPADPEAGRIEAERVLRLAASRGQHDVQAWHTRKDGSRYWSHSVLIALRDQRGELQGYAKINRDMTEAKQLDDLLRNINDELEKRVVDRTEQLLAANRDLESFSYSVSHDLRSPLRHISSFVSLLQEHLGAAADETTARYLGTIANSTRHMSQLIDGLLAFSRLGRSALNLVPVDFKHVVGTVVAQLAHDTDGRVVDWMVAPDLPVVQGDALLLREVWANLLGNAFKYTRPRERALVEVSWQFDPVRGYVFCVRDNGVGFDTKYAQKLFGVFQRLHRASDFEGTGIGLALTRRIIERHGGSIWAESRPGVGSAFHFSLPIDGPRLGDATDSMPAPLES